MENEKMQVNFAPGVTEATLRVIELHEENELPVLEPDKVELAGTIGSVHEFLLKRISEKEQINQKRCYILVDREKMTLKLVTNETDRRNKAFKVLQNESCLLQGCTIQHGTGNSLEELQSQH